MALDGITTACMAHELNLALSGSRISKIIQPENDALLFTLKSPSGQRRLLMSAAASLPLIYLTPNNRQAPASAPNFCMLLRKHIGNGKLLRVYQPSLERILRFEIEHYNEMGDLCKKTLVLELMGKYSNIIFLDDKDMIIDSIKHISASVSSVREVLPGRTYFIPDTTGKKNPLDTSEEEFVSLTGAKAMPMAKAIYTTYTGISPQIAEEVCYRAGIDSSQSANSMKEEYLSHLWNIFRMLMEDVAEGNFSPNIITDANGSPVEFSSVPLKMYSDLHSESYSSISEVMESWYAMKDTVTRIRQKSADLRHITATAIDRTTRKLDLQRKQLKDTEKMDKYRLWGEMLHTYGYSAEPGARSITVLNYYNNEELTIPLDDTLTAAENAAQYFDRYTKLKRTAQALKTQVEQTGSDLEQLMQIKTFLEMALNEADLIQVREELADAGYIKKHGAGKRVKITSHPYHYRTSDGYDLYVGKNNYQNDELTFKFADGGDWWFHAKKAPGSHVIAKARGLEELPDHVFEAAASLAAYYSANRASDKVEIDYIQRKHVKKPSGARPGFVVYYTNYSMVAGTDISALTLVE